MTEGDCGACVLGGMLNTSVEAAYLYADAKAAMPYSTMRNTLTKLLDFGQLDFLDIYIPFWPQSNSSWGTAGWLQFVQWWHRIRLATLAGAYGLVAYDMDQKGPGTQINHWVLICGTRARTLISKTDEGETAYISREVLVSCSAEKTPNEEWVESHHLLKTRGGFNVLLARPSF